MDENIALAGILWKFLRQDDGQEVEIFAVGAQQYLCVHGTVDLSDEEVAVLREIARRKDLNFDGE